MSQLIPDRADSPMWGSLAGCGRLAIGHSACPASNGGDYQSRTGFHPAPQPRTGSVMLEFALTGTPLLFVILSLVWMSIGMWQYHTLAEAVSVTARAASVHGAGCAGQTCSTTVGAVATLLAGRAIGIPSSQLNVTLTSSASTVTCNPLSSCTSNSAAWPSLAGNTAVTTNIAISATYPFSSPIPLWTPHNGSMLFHAITLGAQSTQAVMF